MTFPTPRSRPGSLLALLLLTPLLMAGCGSGSSPPAGSTETAPANTDPKIVELMVPDTRPVLKTEDLDSGKVQLDTAEAPRLMELLNDLKERRDYDRSQHDGQPGPDGPYLDERIHRIASELQRRGYPLNNDGIISQKQ